MIGSPNRYSQLVSEVTTSIHDFFGLRYPQCLALQAQQSNRHALTVQDCYEPGWMGMLDVVINTDVLCCSPAVCITRSR